MHWRTVTLASSILLSFSALGSHSWQSYIESEKLRLKAFELSNTAHSKQDKCAIDHYISAALKAESLCFRPLGENGVNKCVETKLKLIQAKYDTGIYRKTCGEKTGISRDQVILHQ